MTECPPAIYILAKLSVGSDSMTEIKVTNLIQNPDFTPSAAGWNNGVYDATHALYGTHSLRLDGTTDTAEVVAATTATIAFSQSHIYYVRCYTYHTAGTPTVEVWWPLVEPYSPAVYEGTGAPNQWVMHSAVKTRQDCPSGLHQARLDNNNGNAAVSVWFDGAMIIDLTEAFGAGNEPTKDWCDENIPFVKEIIAM